MDTGVEAVKGDVVNLVPPQKAGLIALKAGLAGEDKRGCQVDQVSFESTLAKDIHVIGDACVAGAMPKSGYSSNSHGKTCAMNVVNLMNGKELVEPSGINVCYSFITDREAISIAVVYKVGKGATVAVPNSGGLSPDLSEPEGAYARSWINNILSEMSS